MYRSNMACIKEVLLVILVMASFVSLAKAAVIADSVSEFSSVQGQNSWFYGYYNKTADGGASAVYNFMTDFQLMTQFRTIHSLSSFGTGPAWCVNDGVVYTSLWANGGHGNGLVTSGGRTPVEHFAIRRWISDFTGLVRISGAISKIDPSSASNGIAGLIRLNGNTIFAQFVSGQDTVGTTYSTNLNIQQGDTVDFFLDPWAADDLGDAGRFTAQITAAAPEPGALALLLTSSVPVIALARRRLSQ